MENWRSGGLLGAGIFLLFSLVFVWFRGRAGNAQKTQALPRTCEVRRFSLGFDWTARARLQAQLEELAGKHDLNSVQGLHLAAAEAQRLLVGALDAAHYAMWTREHLSPEEAEEKLPRLAIELRARFSESTVRNDQAIERGALRVNKADGPGMVVVSMILGITHHLPDPPAALDRAAMRQLLQNSLPANANDLVSLEVIWSPSDDSDRMSSRELEQFYPELRRLDDGAAFGGTSCGYCKAVYAREIGRCPVCGAPAA